MKLEFDNLAVYAASIGVWKPILIEWVGSHTSIDDEWVAHGAWHTWDFDSEDPDREIIRHVIGLPHTEEDLEIQLRSLRHELEHAKQVEEVGPIEFESSYWSAVIDIEEDYAANPYEVEANHVMETEWQDLLPCVKGPKL